MNTDHDTKKAAFALRGLYLFIALAEAAFAAILYNKVETVGGSGRVEYTDDDPNGLSLVMGQSIGMYLRKEPKKKSVADRMNVSIAIQDITAPDVATTINFKGSDVSISDGVAPSARIYIGTELPLLLAMGNAGTGLQLIQWLGTKDGRNMVKAFTEGRIKMKGVVLNAPQMMKFQTLLAPDTMERRAK